MACGLLLPNLSARATLQPASLLQAGEGRQDCRTESMLRQHVFTCRCREGIHIFESCWGTQSEAVCNPCCNSARGYDRDDCCPDGCSEEWLRSIHYYDLNKEAGIDFLVTSDLRGMLTVKISEKHPMAKFFQKKMFFLLNRRLFSSWYLYSSYRPVIVKGKSTQSGTDIPDNGGTHIMKLIAISHMGRRKSEYSTF